MKRLTKEQMTSTSVVLYTGVIFTPYPKGVNINYLVPRKEDVCKLDFMSYV